MIITLAGPNAYLRHRRLNELVNKFVNAHGELALERIDADEAGLSTVLDAVSAVPFLANRKMVVVRDLSKNKPAAEAIEQIISSNADSTDLIIYETITDKRTAYYKTLKSKTQLEEFTQMDNLELAKWLVSEAKKLGGELSFADANFLVERVGANHQLLASELQKLSVYEPKISRANIELLTDPTPQSRIFELLAAAFAGRKARALELYEDQRSQKVEPQRILAMIGWQLRLIALAKHAGERKTAQIAKDSGTSPYPIDQAKGLAGKISEARLREMTAGALDIDIRGKTTSLDMDEALKNYIVTL